MSRYGFLVRNAAMRHRNSPEPVEDLIQAGYIGLLNAINNCAHAEQPDRRAGQLREAAAACDEN